LGVAALLALSARAEPVAPLSLQPAAALSGQAAPSAGTGEAPRALPEALAQDPVARLLADKGLIPSGAARAGEIARQVRDTASDVASDLVLSAMNFLGVPYKRGGTSAETGFDCSGFTRYIFESSVGLVLPRRAEEQARAPGVIHVARDELKPGDLVFFNTLRRTFSHVGIYVGDNKFIHSPRSGSEVRVEDMRLAYWTRRFDGARRVPLAAAAGPSLLAPALAALPGHGGRGNPGPAEAR
jgi:cell wall-associated NlpC family hydrolase